ncbi:MAG: anthranilate phosphoribosyltransferase [Desulfuromonadales bacterium]
MIKEAIGKVVLRENLSETEMIDVMNEIMGGEATPAQVGAFITALRMKGETIDEIAGAARVMRDRATPIRVGQALDIDREEINLDRETILDTCGTGGSGTKSFNISTTVAFVVAACGIKVAKHGNRSISSACGSADVLEALGVNLNVTPAQVEMCIRDVGVGFLFAPALHGAMKHAIGPRREIGIRTLFNILGPLTNPAGADRQVLGVYDEPLVETMAKVLVRLGCQRGFVVHGLDGMDEVTLTGPQGGNAVANAAIVRDVLAGANGPKRDVVLLNAAYALVAAGVAQDVADGLEKARNAIDDGLAMAKLEGLIASTKTTTAMP